MEGKRILPPFLYPQAGELALRLDQIIWYPAVDIKWFLFVLIDRQRPQTTDVSLSITITRACILVSVLAIIRTAIT